VATVRHTVDSELGLVLGFDTISDLKRFADDAQVVYHMALLGHLHEEPFVYQPSADRSLNAPDPRLVAYKGELREQLVREKGGGDGE
jgi:hypothetical protein